MMIPSKEKDKEEVLENMDREDLNELVYWERYQ